MAIEMQSDLLVAFTGGSASFNVKLLDAPFSKILQNTRENFVSLLKSQKV